MQRMQISELGYEFQLDQKYKSKPFETCSFLYVLSEKLFYLIILQSLHSRS